MDCAPRSSRISSGAVRISSKRRSKVTLLLGLKVARRWSSRSGTMTNSGGSPRSAR